MANPHRWFSVDAGRIGRCIVPHHHMVTTDMGDVAVRDTGGDGPALVLCHGWSADSLLNWMAVFGPLHADGWRVVAVDSPGHGHTPSVRRFTIDDAALYVVAALDALGVTDAVYAGYSMGGPVTQLAVRHDPGRVRHLVQIATAAHIVPSGVNSTLLAGAGRAFGLSAAAADTLGRVVGRHGEVGSAVGHALGLVRGSSKRALAQAAIELAAYDSRDWVGSLQVPASSIITAKDRAVPVVAQRELAQLLAATAVEVPTGHAVCLEGNFTGLLRNALHGLSHDSVARK